MEAFKNLGLIALYAVAFLLLGLFILCLFLGMFAFLLISYALGITVHLVKWVLRGVSRLV